MMYEKAAKAGNLIYRVSTLTGAVLTVALFLLRGKMGTFHLVLFLAWMALSVYSSVKTVADLASGRNARELNFQTVLAQWESRTGTPAAALRSFWTITLVTALGKLALPFLLYMF